MKKFYLSAPIDEVALKNKVVKDYPWLLEKIPTRDEILKIQNEKDVDSATISLFISLMHSEKYSPFIKAIDAQIINKDPIVSSQLKWCLLPAMLYEDHPEVGGGGEHIISVAQNLGMNIVRLPTGGKWGVIRNAHILKKWISELGEDDFGVISLSKGSLEFRYAYTFLFSDEERKRMKFWLNFGGFPYGSALADSMLNDWKSKLYVAIARRVIKMEYEVLSESRSDFKAWEKDFRINSHSKVFSFFPLPLTSHIQTSLTSRFKRLSKFGPNDGMAECYKASYWDGEVYPIWGADHFCRTPEMITLLYKIFTYINNCEQVSHF